MSKPHKHAKLIKAWADGAEIQVKSPAWANWHTINDPDWNPDDRYQYRIKPSIEIPEGFMPWDGGECPVNPSCIVEILLRNGETNKNNFGYSADLFRWDHTGVEHDIIAYKVIKNAPVVRWQWIYRCFGKLIMTERFYASEEEFREHNRATEIELLKKADWTRTEFDE